MTATRKRPLPAGVRARHARSCPAGEACTCSPTYQARVWVPVDEKHKTATFTTASAAKAWIEESNVKVRAGELRGPTKETIRQAGDRMIADMESGKLRKRSDEHQAVRPTRL